MIATETPVSAYYVAVDTQVRIAPDVLDSFCSRWLVREFAIFGSALRPDFGPASDIDVLLTFEPEARWTLYDLTAMQEELSALFGRSVDIVSRRGLEASRNHIRRDAILASARVLRGA